MPEGVRHIGGMFPLRWYQIALRRVIERGAGPQEGARPDARARPHPVKVSIGFEP